MLNPDQTIHPSPIKNSYPYITTQKQKKSSIFISQTSRFNNPNQDISPGPCAYSYKPIKTNFPHHLPKDHSPVKKQYQWILDNSSRLNYPSTQNNKILGPGSYQINVNKIKSDHSGWNKSDRFQPQSPKNQVQVGPGSYDFATNSIKISKSSASSAFKSQVPKGFIEQIKQNRSKTLTKQFKDNFQTIENVQQKKQDKKTKIKQLSSFASKLQRFQKLKQSLIGPGSYEPGIQKGNKLPKIITIHDSYRYQVSKQPQKPTPGPGQYDVKKTLSNEINKIGNKAFLQKQERFQHQKIEKSPGPGHYNKKQYVYVKEAEKNLPKASFLSKSERKFHMLQSVNNPFGSYNVQLFNLEYKVKKKKQHLEKLKIMQVEVPPFNSRQKK